MSKIDYITNANNQIIKYKEAIRNLEKSISILEDSVGLIKESSNINLTDQLITMINKDIKDLYSTKDKINDTISTVRATSQKNQREQDELENELL